ncbi:MAG: transglutaminase family protein [Gammaproteobacteria bacterium]|nr:MAG: transglutaminase family protein [Gammaproteobacteria bacterium]
MTADDRPTPATLQPTELIDSDHPEVVAFAREFGRGADDRERAVNLYVAVRDQVRYDLYRIDLSPDGMRASTALLQGYGWCVPKAALLAAACRTIGIPARVGYADVRNHLSTERIRRMMQTDIFIWHGYTDIWIDGAWRKATPAFNLDLCERFGLLPLEFNGVDDSLYHPYDRAGNRHMEYVRQRGSFDDMPLAALAAETLATYPDWMREAQAMTENAFLDDVAREVSSTG